MKKALSLFLSLLQLSHLAANGHTNPTVKKLEAWTTMFPRDCFSNKQARNLLRMSDDPSGLCALNRALARRDTRHQECLEGMSTSDLLWQANNPLQLLPQAPGFCPLFTQGKIGFIAALYKHKKDVLSQEQIIELTDHINSLQKAFNNHRVNYPKIKQSLTTLNITLLNDPRNHQ